MSGEASARRYDVVLFDFHGVLCSDYFYANLEASHPDVHAFVEQSIFRPGSDIVDRWTRGEMTSDDVNWFVSKRTGISFEELDAAFRESVARMRVDARLVDLARMLGDSGVSVGIVTGNMDVFREIVVPRNRLDQVFPAIVSSSDHGCQKEEQDGRLFDIALALLGRPGEYARALLVDDSEQSRAAFLAKGGHVFPYADYEGFSRWAEEAFGMCLDGQPASVRLSEAEAGR